MNTLPKEVAPSWWALWIKIKDSGYANSMVINFPMMDPGELDPDTPARYVGAQPIRTRHHIYKVSVGTIKQNAFDELQALIPDYRTLYNLRATAHAYSYGHPQNEDLVNFMDSLTKHLIT